uniref:Uncharacterized protein n=1 Tax=Antarctic circular DNA molecule TaxID=2664238 RepID=A0A5Q2F5Z9_9ZZZZ|nr:hypothetical protein [Antarctic circular DNA molecule]
MYMLEQENSPENDDENTPAYDIQETDDRISHLADIMYEAESCIETDGLHTPKDTVYLLTWSPDPKFLPDCDFQQQHLYAGPWAQFYMQTTKCGACCVEANQMGNPHYHMWYQPHTDFNKTKARITMIKVLKNRGIVKIDQARHVRPGCPDPTCNSLHYYKKELFDQNIWLDWPIITHLTRMPNPIHENFKYWFQLSTRKNFMQQVEVTSEYKRIHEFYKKSE